MTKIYPIIILPTEDKSRIGYLTGKSKDFKDLRYFDTPLPNNLMGGKNFEIYILSDDEIKSGDLIINKYKPKSSTTKPFIINTAYPHLTGYSKVIASTDNSLNIPGIPKEYLKYYISEYNKGNVLTEIKLRIDKKYHTYEDGFNNIMSDKLKLQNNEVVPVIDEFKAIKSKLTKEQIDEINWDTVRDLKAKGLPVIFDTSTDLDVKTKQAMNSIIKSLAEMQDGDIIMVDDIKGIKVQEQSIEDAANEYAHNLNTSDFGYKQAYKAYIAGWNAKENQSKLSWIKEQEKDIASICWEQEMNPDIGECLFHRTTDEDIFKSGVLSGAKYIESKMYSEDEVKELLNKALNSIGECDGIKVYNYPDGSVSDIDGLDKWFELNKK